MHYKWLERRFLVSLRCLGVMRAAQPSQVIKDNQGKMWGSVVLRIPNPTYNRNSTRNYYLNLTLFQSRRWGTGLAVICLLMLLCSQKTRERHKTVSGGSIPTEMGLKLWASFCVFLPLTDFYQQHLPPGVLNDRPPSASPEVGLIYHRIFIGTNNSFNKCRNNNANNSTVPGKGSQVFNGQGLPLKPYLSWGAVRVTGCWITLKNQVTYSGADSARELLSVEQFGKSGLRVPFISGALWTHWHKPCSLHSGNRGAASPGHTKGCRPAVCCLAWCCCKVTAEASEAGGDFRRVRCAARLLMDALDHRETESKAGPRQPVWQREVAVQHIRTQGQKGCCKPAPPAPYPVPLLSVGVRKSNLTCWGVCFPRSKHPLTPRGWGWPKQDQRIPWSWRKTGAIWPLWALRTCKQTAWHAEPVVLLPCPESSSLLASYATGKRACETKQFKMLDTAKKIT